MEVNFKGIGTEEVAAIKAAGDVEPIKDTGTSDREEMEGSGVELIKSDDENTKGEAWLVVKIVEIDVREEERSGAEEILPSIPLKEVFKKMASPEAVTDGVEGVTKDVENWLEESPRELGSTDVADLLKGIATLLEETTTCVWIETKEERSVDERISFGPVISLEEVGST